MEFVKIRHPDGEFQIQDAPITQAEWKEIMGFNRSYYKGNDNPVEAITWYEAQGCITKLNTSQKKDEEKFVYRLPTEKEWEFAAGKKPPEDILNYAWCTENSDYKPHAVRKKLPNEFGLYDMLGNVWEWCEDLWDPGDNLFRVIRGGDFSRNAQVLQPSLRFFALAEDHYDFVGVRLVRTSVPQLDIEVEERKLKSFGSGRWT